MNDSEWLQSRRPPPPPKLSERVQLAATPFSDDSKMSRSERLARGAVALLAPLFGPGAPDISISRDVAIDLLAADALVTYAIESAADDCATIGQNVDLVVEQLISLASTGQV